ncbi:hypothetical protein RvY_03164 [Ramazzottius varieornatus]|uniref:Uncharacterized protein n=1 Tax=Ramazzottius varieornatus TaxID=947166 RepID=A0A1D1UXB2_RAMVA|nr:hypothetical protein RvY_03164 [Ramazzottius varieornatus]
MSSLRNGGESLTSYIPESADATKSTVNSEPVKRVKKTVIYKKTIIYNFTKVFAATAEAARLKQLSSAESSVSADSQLSVAEVVWGLGLDAQREVPKPVEEITEKEEVAVTDQRSAVSIDATLEVLLQIMPTIPSVPAPPPQQQQQAVREPPPAAAPAVPAVEQASLPVALPDVVPPKAEPKVLNEKPFCFEDYWEERWVSRDNQPAGVFTMSSNVTVKPAEKAAAPVVNEQVPEVRTYTAPFRGNDWLNDLAASPVLPAAVKPRKKPDPLKTKENQPRQERNSTAKEKSAKAKQAVVQSPAFTPRVLAESQNGKLTSHFQSRSIRCITVRQRLFASHFRSSTPLTT